MTKAIVKNGVIGLITDAEVVMGADYINHRIDEPTNDLIAAGIYEYTPAPNDCPSGKKRDGDRFEIDAVLGTVKRFLTYVDMTQDEIKVETNSALDAQIESLERQQLLPRITRDMHKMVTLQAAAAQGITEANLLDENHPAYSPGYRRFYDFDASIALLRASRV